MTSPLHEDRVVRDALHAVCLPPSGPQAGEALARLITDTGQGLGGLIALAIDRKVLCLLAAAAEPLAARLDVPPRMRRFLQQQLSVSQYTALAYRSEAARITGAAQQRGLAFAVVKGLAVEHSLYAGRGARSFTDLDLLVEPADLPAFGKMLTALGYRLRDDPRPHSGTYINQNEDLIVPRFVLDLDSRLPGCQGASWLTAALRRRIHLANPSHPTVSLPVLSDPDQLTFSLAAITDDMNTSLGGEPALNLCADVLRLHHCGTRVPTPPGPLLLPAIQWIGQIFPAAGLPALATGHGGHDEAGGGLLQ